MAGLLVQLDLTVSGADLSAIAGSVGGAYGELGRLIAGWQSGPPGDFGSALADLAGLPVPQLSGGFEFSLGFGTLLPNLQGELGGLAQALQADIAALPERLGADLQAAFAPLLARIARLQAVFNTDWHCGLAIPADLTAGAGPASSSAGASTSGAGAEGGGEGRGEGSGATGTNAAGALDTAQVTAANALIDTLPADLSVPSLLRWLHARVGTFRPGYFQLRSLPVLDDLRDPLDTLIRWDDASAAAVEAELQQTLEQLAALIAANTSAHIPRALPAADLATQPGIELGSAGADFVTAVSSLAALTAAQPTDSAAIAAALANAQALRAPLLAARNVTLAPASTAARARLHNALLALPGALDAGLCRTLVLLLPRASLADLTQSVPGLAIPGLPANAFAALEALIDDIQTRLETVLDLLDISAVSAPVTTALARANSTLANIEAQLAALGASSARAFDDARSQLQTLDLARLQRQFEQSLEQAVGAIEAALAATLAPATTALAQALQAADTAMDAIDPEALSAPLQQILQPLASLSQQEDVARLIQVLGQVKALSESLSRISFAPVADEVIAAIGKLEAVLRAIDPATLPAPGPELIRSAMSVLPPSLVPLTDPLIVRLDTQLEASPTELLTQLKAIPEEARARLLALSPRAALAPLLAEPFAAVRDGLAAFQPAQWLDEADRTLADTRQRLGRQLDIGGALAAPAQAHGALVRELEGLRPSALLQPLTTTLGQALQALDAAVPAGELGTALAATLDRIRSFASTLASALDVADHLVDRLGTLGDAGSEFDSWLDGILAKIPETATAAQLEALDTLRQAALASSADALRAQWAAHRDALATTLADTSPGTQSAALLRELALARARIRGQLGALPPALANPIASWLDEADTRAAEDGLIAIAALSRRLAETDARMTTLLDQLGNRFPAAQGPFAALLPGNPVQLRAWVREALVRQFGRPLVLFLDSLQVLVALLRSATAALRRLVDALQARLDELLAAPQALAALLEGIESLTDRVAGLDPGLYAQQVDTLYRDLLGELRALDPAGLRQPLEATRDRLLARISLDTVIPPAQRAQLDAMHRELQAKVGALDPDPLLLQPLDETWRATVEPLVAALDASASIQLIVDWINALPPELRLHISRVDAAYAALLASAPGGSGASVSVSASVSVGT